MSFCDNSTDCVSGVQTDSDSFILLSSSGENRGPWSLTFHSHSFPLRLSSSQTHGCRRSHKNDTYFSDLVYACVRAHAGLLNLHIWMCACTVCVCVCVRVTKESHAVVWHVDAVNWIEDVRKTMTHSLWGLFVETLKEKEKPSKQSILWGNVNGSRIPTANENIVCQVSLIQWVGQHYTAKGGRETWESRSQTMSFSLSKLLVWGHSRTSPWADACGITMILNYHAAHKILS